MIFNSLPVIPLRITGSYGPRKTNIIGATTNHKGVDLGANNNLTETPILCVSPGTISRNYWNDIRGWVLVVSHGQGYSTLYQHLKEQSLLSVGSKVYAGQQIGIMGNSSKTLKMAKHLHFELLLNGTPIDPTPYLLNIKEDVLSKMTNEELKNFIKEVIKEELTGNNTQVSSWAKSYWDQATKEGITDGSRPKGYITREQVIAMLMRKDK